MSKVLFLGAGASKDAGYPLAKDLLKEVLKIKKYPDDHLVKFKKYLSNAKGIFKKIFELENPELVVSMFDLLEHALPGLQDKIINDAQKKAKKNEDITYAKEILGNYYYQELCKAKRVKDNLVRLLDNYFTEKADDSIYASVPFDYLNEAFEPLGDGDSIITTNWDLLAEMVLVSQGKWSPKNGYGFNRNFESKRVSKRKFKKIKIMFHNSQVKIFKLHGSIGWYLNSVGELYLRDNHYFNLIGLDNSVKDICSPGSGPDENPVLIYPTYLKQLNNYYLQDIWHQASHKLTKAKEITFVGYSLPDADMAIRVLLNPLRKRLEQGKVRINVVIGPDSKSLRENEVEIRWKQFLGEKIHIHKKSAKDYFMEN